MLTEKLPVLCFVFCRLGCKPTRQEHFVPCMAAAAGDKNIGDTLQQLLLCFPDTGHRTGTVWLLAVRLGGKAQDSVFLLMLHGGLSLIWFCFETSYHCVWLWLA